MVEDILNKYRRGDHLTDEELITLKEAMEAAMDATSQFGLVFHTTYAYAAHVYHAADSSLWGRQLNKRPRTGALYPT